MTTECEQQIVDLEVQALTTEQSSKEAWEAIKPWLPELRRISVEGISSEQDKEIAKSACCLVASRILLQRSRTK